MKKIFFILILLVSAFSVIYFNPFNFSLDKYIYFSYCDTPVKYRIDTVDPKFGLSRDDFASDVKKSAEIWNSQYEKDLFLYDPEGQLSVNLVYDERQSLTTQIDQLKDKVQSDKSLLTPKISEFQKKSSEFKQNIDNLNKEIDFWNSKGGAPAEEYDKIVRKQQELKTEANNLNQMAQSLNLSTDTLNNQVDQLNQTISTFNTTLEGRPEEGIFMGPENRIEIYFNINKPELIHTITHEFGHALGIGHNNNPKSIMYPKTSQTVSLAREDLIDLQEACKQHSILEPLQARIAQIISGFGKLFTIPN